MADRRQHLVGLDGFRGIAAILVVFIHLSQEGKFPIGPNNFALAVDFFFMLSGFVIGLSYERKLLDGAIGLGGFVRIRLIRLYPIIFLAALVGIAWRVFEGRFPLGAIAMSGVMAIALLPVPRLGNPAADAYPINGPGWSLTQEFAVNILFAVLVRWLQGRRLWAAFALMAATEIALALWLGRLDFSTRWGDVGFALVRAAAPFLLGVILYRESWRWKPAPSDLVPVAGGVALALILCAPFGGLAYPLACIFVLFPCVMVAGAVQPRSRGVLAILALLGELSYPLYAINQPMLRWLGALVNSPAFARLNIPRSVDVVVMLVVLCACAMAVSRLYDLPVRAALRRAGR
jgi:peptidoglycan/LPS O-acetylase OafA/YrhL